jgi:hypothetical protein
LIEEFGYPDLKSYREWLSYHRIFTATGFAIDEKLDYCQLVNSFLEQKQQRERKPFVGATVHRHFNRLLRIWPDAKFIHILRDPRDVARSVLNIGWVGHIYYGADRWMDAERTWHQLIEGISSDRYVELRYEKLLKDPETELLSAWHLIGVDPSKYIMKYWEQSTYDAPNPKLAYQWKYKLKPHEIQLVEYRLGPMLAAKGYRSSGHPPIRPSRLTQLRLAIQNRLGRAINRRSRYGTWMWIASILAPRLPLKHWHRSVRLRLNEIERSQLK